MLRIVPGTTKRSTDEAIDRAVPPRQTSLILDGPSRPLAIGSAPRPTSRKTPPRRSVALGFSILLALSYGVFGASAFLSPGQDLFEAIGILFGAASLALAALSLFAAFLALRGDGGAWGVLAIPAAIALFALSELVP